MIYERNFITNVHVYYQCSRHEIGPSLKPISRHAVTHLGQLPPRKLSKLTAGLSKLSMRR